MQLVKLFTNLYPSFVRLESLSPSLSVCVTINTQSLKCKAKTNMKSIKFPNNFWGFFRISWQEENEERDAYVHRQQKAKGATKSGGSPAGRTNLGIGRRTTEWERSSTNLLAPFSASLSTLERITSTRTGAHKHSILISLIQHETTFLYVYLHCNSNTRLQSFSIFFFCFGALHLWAGYIMNVSCCSEEIYTELTIVKQHLSLDIEREMTK